MPLALRYRNGYGARARPRISGRVITALIVAAVALIGYFSRSAINPVTGQKQHIAMTVDQEIGLGLQAAPEMARQFGGLSSDMAGSAEVKAVGARIVASIESAGRVYPFDFHLLADPQTINAFALPGGQVFITQALYDRLKTEGQLAGVLAHEIGHVVERHSAEHLAKAQLTQGLTGAAVIASYDPRDGSGRGAATAALLAGQLINLRFGRTDELEADKDGVRFMAGAGYDPRSMVKVMEVLASSREGRGPPEFFSTHPNPENRIPRIERAIKEVFPGGVPEGLKE
jgi:beta-barrel assembly-enhancing protease